MFNVWPNNRLLDFYSKVFIKYPFLKLQLRYQDALFEADKYLLASWERFLQGRPAQIEPGDKILSKDDLHKFCSSEYYRGLNSFAAFTTSGTSGLPLTVKRDLYSTADVFFSPLMKALLKRRTIGFGSRDIFSCFISDRPGMIDSALINPTNCTGLFTRIGLKTTHPDSYADIIKKINVMKPEVITSKPNLLENLLGAHRTSLPITATFSAIVSSGAMLPYSLKEELESTFNCPVINSYGATEFGYIGSSCSSGNIHTDVSSCLVQDGGELGLLISSHVNPLLKLERYAIGDWGSLSEDICPCGDESPYLKNLSGRKVVQFLLSNGQKVSPTCLMHIFSDNPDLEEFQLTQIGTGKFTLHLQARKKIAPEIVAYIQAFIPEPIDVQCTYKRIDKDSKFVRYRRECF